MVAIRAEDDPVKIKEFTPEQKKIRNEYRKRKAKGKSGKEVTDAIERIKQAFIGLAKT
jgi:hypothetical protein